jgi:outer membrane protein assembly factor BamB/SAM-dependent methyltransferase
MIPKIRETVSGRRWERPLRNRGTGDLTISSLKKHVLALGAIVVLASSSRPTVVSAEGPEGRQILEVAGVPGGLVVHLGCGDGRLTAALRGGSGYVVHGLDDNPANVERARQTIREAGLYGPVSVERWTDPTRLPYAENLVNLLLAEDLGRVPMSEVLRVLAPRGVACVGKNGQWTKTVKPWPAEMDEWTHWMHAPDGNPVSLDRLVGPPRQTQWIDGLPYSKKHWGPRTTALVTAGGRLFTIEDETPSTLFNVADHWVLIARDAFNGIVLWRRELPRWARGVWTATRKKDVAEPPPTGLLLGAYGEQTGAQGGREAMETMVATSRHLFVPLAADEPLSMLDAATGEVLKAYDGTSPPQQVVLTGGLLLIGSGQQIAAVAPETGLTKWQAAGKALAAEAGRGYVLRAAGDKLACLDLQDGQTLWETAYAQAAQTLGVKKPAAGKVGFTGSLQVGAGIVLAPYRAGLKNSETMVLDAATGRPLWVLAYHDRPFGDGGGPFITEDGVIVLDSASGAVRTFDAKTGQPKNALDAPAIRFAGHHPRCYESRLTPRFIIGKQRGADFVDLASGEVTWCNWLRGSCHRGAIPANGLLYAGQHSCRCYTEAALRGLNALAPRSGEAAAAPRPDAPVRLERGPVFETLSSTESPASSHDDWPTYRHDAARSGASPCALGDKLAPAWTAALSGRLTAPVVGDGRLAVAATDQHAVHAFDASTGKPLWCFTAGGRIDSPPTLHAGLALFGCHDGYVYCLRADTGALAWRFRAAPRERKVGAYGQIESAWPVPGSILVREGSDGQATAYCVAGRSSFLDGGMTVFGLDPRNGAVRCSRPLDGPWQDPAAGSTPDNPNRGFTMPGSLPDVMVADAEHLYLRQLRFDPALRNELDMAPNYYKSPQLTGENRGGDHKYWDNLIEAPRHAVFNMPAWFYRSYFQNFPGRRLFSTTGLLNGNWHSRMYWAYGQVTGQYLVFRGPVGYAVQQYATTFRDGGANAGEGYVIAAGETQAAETDTKLFALRARDYRWRVRVAVRPVAMALAGDKLLLAGPPDRQDPAEALAALEGRHGGVLLVLSAADGKVLSESTLATPPVFDGLAIAQGRLYVSTADGKVLCIAD